MGSKPGIIARPWTESERDTLRRLVDDGMSLKEISVALGRSHGAIQTMANKMRLTTWENVLPATRESIRHFASQGWASSRIAKRFGVSAKAVDLWTGRTPA